MRVVGLMSGTSIDAIDVAVADVGRDPEQEGELTLRYLGYRDIPFPAGLREEVLSMLNRREARLDALTELNFRLGAAFGDAVLAALQDLAIDPESIDLVASPGQTIYHLIDPGRYRSTLQIGEGAVIAERTGRTVVTDFRVADVAAGGQGAPLISFFDALFFAGPETRAVQNIGGMANVTFVEGGGGPAAAHAFDTGPGNALIDYGARYFSAGASLYDGNGAMARAGRVNKELLEETLAHPYFRQPPPKTTGRELFGDQFAAALIARAERMDLSPEDTMATLTAVTTESIVRAYRDFGPRRIDEVILSGGGASNAALVEGLRQRLPGVRLRSHDEFGIPANAKEAVTFALLGYETVHGRPANVPAATGATRQVVLGKIVPGRNYSTVMRCVAGEGMEDGGKPITSLRLVS